MIFFINVDVVSRDTGQATCLDLKLVVLFDFGSHY